MAREYAIPMIDQTITNASPTTLIFFQAPSSLPVMAIEVKRAWMSQAGTSTSAMLKSFIATQVTSFPTLVSTAPVRLKSGDPVSRLTGGTTGAEGTAGTRASAEGAGGKTTIIPDNFNNLNGYLWVPTPDETIVEAAQSTAHGLGLGIVTAPSPVTNWSAGFIIKELS